MKTVLSLCDRTGNMVRPWHQAGFRCVCVDIQHPWGWTEVEPNLFFVGADILWWLPEKIDYHIVFAFPPCTHLAVSGAQWFKRKGLRKLTQGLEVLEKCRDICEWADAKWMLENPRGVIKSHWRPANWTFHPWNYAGYLDDIQIDNTNKETFLWTGGGFVMPTTKNAPEPHRNDVHEMAPSDDRGDLRSITPAGFAKAVFEFNK